MTNALATKATMDLVLPDFGETPQFDAPPQSERRTVYWMNGQAQMKKSGGLSYFGGWCIDSAKVTPDILNAGAWELESMTARSGKEFEVFTSPVIGVAMLGWRESWTQRQKAEGEKPVFQEKYADGLTSYVEIAAIANTVQGAIVLTAKGYNADRLKKSYAKAVSDLNLAYKKPVPPYLFYMALGGEVNEKREPVFTLHGKGKEQSPIVHIMPRWTMSKGDNGAERIDPEYLRMNVVTPDVRAAAEEFVGVHLARWKTERFQQVIEVAAEDEGGFGEP